MEASSTVPIRKAFSGTLAPSCKACSTMGDSAVEVKKAWHFTRARCALISEAVLVGWSSRQMPPRRCTAQQTLK